MVHGQAVLLLAEALHDAGLVQGPETLQGVRAQGIDVAEGDRFLGVGRVRLEGAAGGPGVVVPHRRGRSRLDGQEHGEPPAVSVDMAAHTVEGTAAVAQVGVEVDHAPASASRRAWAATLAKACAYWSISSSAGRVKAGSWIVSEGTSGSSVTGRTRLL